jgi:uncharacterized protein (TIGR02246 family)
MKRTSWNALCLAWVLSLGVFSATARADEPRSQDEAAIRQLVATQAEAWNRHDATAWSKNFAPDADFVNIVGTVFTGQPEIEKRHATVFASIFKSSQTRVTVRRLVFLDPIIAVVAMEHEVTGHSALPPGVQNTDASGTLRTQMKYVMRKSDGKWQIVSAQNTDVKPPPPSAKK